MQHQPAATSSGICNCTWSLSSVVLFSVVMQENPNAIPEGETPHSVTLFAHDHLVDMAKPGDRVVLTGIYKVQGMRVNPRMSLFKSTFKYYIDAVHISKDERTKNFAAKHDDSMANDFSQEKTQQKSEEPAFQVNIWSTFSWQNIGRHPHL